MLAMTWEARKLTMYVPRLEKKSNLILKSRLFVSPESRGQFFKQIFEPMYRKIRAYAV
jgi:hypothetical protein